MATCLSKLQKSDQKHVKNPDGTFLTDKPAILEGLNSAAKQLAKDYNEFVKLVNAENAGVTLTPINAKDIFFEPITHSVPEAKGSSKIKSKEDFATHFTVKDGQLKLGHLTKNDLVERIRLITPKLLKQVLNGKELNQPIDKPTKARLQEIIEQAYSIADEKTHWLDLDKLITAASGLKDSRVSHKLILGMQKAIDIIKSKGFSIIDFVKVETKKDTFLEFDDSDFNDSKRLMNKILSLVINENTDKSKIPDIKSRAEDIAMKFMLFKEAAYDHRLDDKTLNRSLATQIPFKWIMEEDADGNVTYRIPNHLLFSMFINADNWLTTRGLNAPLPNDQAKADFLYGDPKHPLTAGDLAETRVKTEADKGSFKGQQIGTTLEGLARELGRGIILDAGMFPKTENKAIKERLYEDLQRDLGLLTLNIFSNLQEHLYYAHNPNPAKGQPYTAHAKYDTSYNFKALENDAALQLYIDKHIFKFAEDAEDNDVRRRRYQPGNEVRFIQVVNLDKIAKNKVDYMDKFRQRNKLYELISGNKHLDDGLPLQQSVVNNNVRPKRGYTNHSKKIQDVVNKLNSIPWHKSDAFDQLLQLFLENKNLAMKLQGAITDIDILSETDQELLGNKNKDIELDYDHIFEALGITNEQGKDLLEEFFIEYGIMSNDRMFQKGHINPQSSHLHRIAFQSHGATEYTENNIDFFKFAVVFNMGLSPDKLISKEIFENFDRILEDKLVLDAIDAHNSGNQAKFAKALEAIIDSNNYGVDPALVAGIVALSKYKAADGKAFSSDISYEVDGITNGFAISLLQYPLEGRSPELYKRLNQIGVFMQSQPTNGDFESYLQNVTDLYTELAERFIENIQDSSAINLDAINLLFDNQFALGKDNVVTTKMRNLLKYPTMIYMYGGGSKRISTEVIQDLLREAQITIVRKRNAFNQLLSITPANRNARQIDAIRSYAEYFYNLDQTINSLNNNNYLTDSDGHTIGSFLVPNLSKDILEKFTNEKTGEYYFDKIPNELLTVRYDITKFNLSHSQQTSTLRTTLIGMFKEAFEASLEDVVGNVVEGRKKVNDVIELQTIVFKSKLEEKVREFVEKHEFTPAEATIKRIIKEELSKFFPTYKGPLDVDGIFNGLDMTNPRPSREPVKDYALGTDSARFALTHNWIDISESSEDFVHNPSLLTFRDAGIRGAIIQIHNMDASIQATAMAANPHGLSLYDAYMGKPETALTTYADLYNNTYLDLSYKHSMSQKALDNLLALKNLLTKEELDYELDYRNDSANRTYIGQWVGNTFRYPRGQAKDVSTIREVFDNLQRDLEINIELRNRNLEMIKNDGAVSKQMFAHHRNVKNVNPESRKEKLLTPKQTAEVTEDKLGSLEVNPENPSVNNTLLTALKVTVNTAKGIFDALSGISNQYYTDTESKQVHENQLAKVFNIMLPVLRQLNGIKIGVNDVDSLTSGFASKHKNEIELNISRNSRPPSLIAQTPTEVYTHETMHILITRAIKDNPLLARKLNRMLDNLKKEVDKAGGPEVFYPDNATDADKKLAQMLYDYLLDNPGNTENELAEFMALGLTNRSYIDVLKKFKNTADTKEGKNLYEKLINLYNEIIDYVVRLIKGRVDNNAYQDLFDIATELTEAQSRAKSRVEQFTEFYTDKQRQLNKALQRKALKAHNTIVKSQPAGAISSKVRGLYGFVANILTQNPTISKLKESYIAQISSDFVRHVIQHVGGVMTPEGRALLLRSNQVVDKFRRMTEENYLKEFNRIMGKLSRSDEKALNELVLKTDLSSLLGISDSLDEIREILTDPKKRTEEMDKLLKVLPKGKNGDLKEYMDEMAHYMMTGMIDENSPIRDGFDSVKALAVNKLNKQQASSEAILQGIDAYITLKALEYAPTPSKTLMNKLSKDEVLSHLLDDHNKYKVRVLNELFNGNAYEMKKGYTKKRHNDFSSYRIGTAKDKDKMKALGYKTQISVGIIPGVNAKKDGTGYEETYLYISSYAPNNKLVAGAASFTEWVPGHKFDLSKMEVVDNLTREEKAKANAKMKAFMEKFITQKMKHPIQIRPIRKTWVSNGVQKQGITGYRLVISDELESKRFGIDQTFQDTFAHMKSHLVDQVNSKMINEEVVDYLVKEQSLQELKSKHFVDILDEKSRYYEYYVRLPSYMQRMIQKRKTNGTFYVRESIIYKILGFEKENLPASLGIDMLKHPWAYKVINGFANVITYLTHTAMGKIALGTTDVVIGNMMSNIYQLAMRGISPVYTLNKIKEGELLYKDYIKNYAEKYNLEQKIERESLSQTSSAAKRVRQLEVRLQNNPMHSFFEKGINSMIVEDTNEASTSDILTYAGYKAKEYKAFDNRAVKGLMTVAGEIYGSPNSQIFRLFKQFTAMTDMLARYVMVEHAGEQAKKAGLNSKAVEKVKAKELDKALEAFVLFDENVTPKLQLFSDLGMVWFARYYLANQRASLQLIREHPTSVAAAAVIQYTTGVDALGNINSSIFGGRLSPQLLMQLEALDIVTNPTYGIDQVLDVTDLALP